MRYWTPALNRAMRRALAIQNELPSVPREWQTIAAKWQSPEYMTASAQADAGMKLIAAAPWLAETEVGLEALGLSQQQIDRAMSEKRRASVTTLLSRMPTQPVEMPQVSVNSAGIGG
jgi:hypothetical protein